MGLLLGIDSGGSRTRAALADGAGRVLARADGLSIKLLHVSREQAEQRLSGLLQQLEEASGSSLRDVRSTCAGISGYGAPWLRSAVDEMLRARVGGDVRLFGDEQIALAEAQLHRDSSLGQGAPVPLVLLIAGTGSHATLCAPGHSAHSGGWGPALGDEGGGTWLGREAVRAALRQLDQSGRAGRSGLLEALLGAWQLDGIPELVAHAHTAGADFAALVPAIQAAAAQDDAIARDLLLRAGGELARLVAILASSVSGTVRLAWTGSILREIATVRDAMREELRHRGVACVIDDAETDPLLGALHLAGSDAPR